MAPENGEKRLCLVSYLPLTLTLGTLFRYRSQTLIEG